MDTNHQFNICVFAPCGKNVVDVACKKARKSIALQEIEDVQLQRLSLAYLVSLQGSLYGKYMSPLVHENLANNQKSDVSLQHVDTDMGKIRYNLSKI